MTDLTDGLAAAVVRIERESQLRDEMLQCRIEELEHHADWLDNRVGQLFLVAFGALAYLIAEEWFGKSIITLIIAFCAAIILSGLHMESWKTPILWRYASRKRRNE